MASSARRVFFMVDPFVASDGTGCTNRTWRSGDDAATSSWRDWQANPEAAASAPALDADLTVLRLDQMLDDGEADPRPARLARTLAAAICPLPSSNAAGSGIPSISSRGSAAGSVGGSGAPGCAGFRQKSATQSSGSIMRYPAPRTVSIRS